MKKTGHKIAIMMVMVFVLVACNKDKAPADSGKKETGNASTSEAAKENKTVPVDATYKKDIIFGQAGKVISIDPQTQSNTQHNYIFRMVFDTPLDFDNATSELKPNIVTEWSTEDSLVYTLKLREDVVFHNGEPLKASDVVFSYDRAPGTDSAATLGKMIEKTEAVDDYTVKITLKAKNVDFPYLLTLPTSSIISEKAVSADELDGPGIGSGPWMLDSYEFGDYIKLIRNDNFWGEPAKTETFTFRYMPEASPRLIALQTGQIDICQDPDTLELSYIEDEKTLELQSYKASSLNYVAMNYQKEPFNNQDFRLALCYGIDAQEIIDVVRNGHAEPALSCWGWNEFGYNGGATTYTYDVEKAKEYVAKAFPNGGAKFDMSISSGERKAIAEIVQAQMKKIGVEVTIIEMDTAGLSTSTTNGEHQAAAYGCGMNVFGDDIRRLICPGTGVNKSLYDNPEVNELMDLAVAESDEAKRVEYYKEVQQILFEDGAYVPLYFSTGFFGVKAGVGGIDYYPTSHHDMSNVYMIES